MNHILYMKPIEKIVSQLDLEPHPEGGYYRETYRSDGLIAKAALPDYYTAARNYATCIYFLLTSDNFSAFHRIKQDEIWHFYSGSPITIHVIDKLGNYQKHSLGSEIENGILPQLVVKGGDWFASEVETKDSYGLAGCTVSPGFDFDDFEMADRDKLISQYPQHHEIIRRLTRA